MGSPAAAIGWEFRQHHRRGLAALAGFLLVVAAIKLAIVVSGHQIAFDSTETFALVVVVPITTTFMYFLAVFSYGLAGDLAARQSMYPARMFTLPITTGALAGWPMLYGTAAMAILWLATRVLGLWPSEFGVPIVWPGLLAASLLAWTQALTWMPYPLPGLRVIVTVLWLTVIDAIVMVELEYKARESVMLAGIPLALVLSGTWPVVVERAGRFRDAVGTPRAIVFALLVCSALIAWTWKRLVQGLYIGLTGREWLIKGHVFLSLLLLAVAGPVIYWIGEHGAVRGAIWDALPWILALLVSVKMSAAAWIITRLYDSRLLSDRTLVTGAACWCAAVLALYGLLVWFVDSPFVAHYVLMLIAILGIPLTRLPAAPLALAWNRHR